jgi:tetratricopeptide (TPR) repeat protein
VDKKSAQTKRASRYLLERYKDWPFISEDLLKEPDPEHIEIQAAALLNRALTEGRVVAFVGAGASMSYGRISWQGLVKAMRARTIDQCATNSSLKTLVTELKEEGSSLPMVLQLTEQLDVTVSEDRKKKQRSEPSEFRQHVMNLTFDARGHAYQILIDALGDIEAIEAGSREGDHEDDLQQHSSANDIRRQVSGEASTKQDAMPPANTIEDFAQQLLAGDPKNSDGYLEIFSVSSAESLVAVIEPRGDTAPLLADLIASVRKYIGRFPRCRVVEQPSAADQGDPACAVADTGTRPPERPRNSALLPPTHRFLIGMLLRLATAEERKCISSSWKQVGSAAPTRGRGEVVSPSRDPLLLLQGNLGIRRFLTTNYDREIQRLLSDQGFSAVRPDTDRVPGSGTVDPLAMQVREFVFSNRQAGSLVAFAAHQGRNRATVVHLHGKAEPGGEIIATESDYQRRYLRNDESRPLVDEAIGFAFAANPILFVGSGMGEDDILRPLRHFMSNPSRFGDRVGVAYLPGDRSKAERNARAIELLQRYGVYVVYFGFASRPGSEDGEEVDWLYRIREIKDHILRGLRVLEQEKHADRAGELQHITRDLEQSVTELWRPSVADKTTSACSRPGPRFIYLPDRIERQDMKPDDAGVEPLRLEVDLLNGALHFIRQSENLIGNVAADSPPEAIRQLANAYRAALTGAWDAILATFLCARLARTEMELNAWRREWMRIPLARSVQHHKEKHYYQRTEAPPRVAETKIPPPPVEIRPPLRVVARHAVRLPTKPGPTSPFFAGAPSQTFNVLMAALSKHQHAIACASGRRIFLLIARRGVGKGHFFAALGQRTDSSPSRLEAFTAIIRGGKVDWEAAVFYNLSFSHEVQSVFDSIIGELYKFLLRGLAVDIEHAKHDEKSSKRAALTRVKKDWSGLAEDRVGRVRFVVERLGEQALQRHGDRRLLIAVNGLDLLFDRRGVPKNAQIKRIFEGLIGQLSEPIAVDFVFVCAETGIPCYFKAPSGIDPNIELRPITIRRAGLTEKGRRAVEFRTVRMELNARESLATYGSRALTMIHLLHEARATVVVNGFFPGVAIAIANRVIARDPPLRAQLNDGNAHATPGGSVWCVDIFSPEKDQAWRMAVRDALAKDDDYGDLQLALVKYIFPSLMLKAAGFIRHDGHATTPRDAERVAAQLGTELKDAIGRWRRAIASMVNSDPGMLMQDAILRAFAGDDRAHRETFARGAAAVDEYMRRIYKAAGRGRYAFSLLMAAAAEILRTDIASKKVSDVWVDENTLEAAAAKAVGFLDRAVHELEAAPEGRRDDAVIEKIRALYYDRHAVSGRTTVPGFDDSYARKKKWNLQAPFFRLLDILVWHLAVIGQPVEQDVLARCPLVSKALADVCSDATQRESILRRSMRLLVSRCLVFELEPEPRPSERANDTRDGVRFAIHRSMRRHVFERLGGPFVDPAEASHFSLTLYASQPNNLPRLRAEAHADLRLTVAALSGYAGNAEHDQLYYDLGKDATGAALKEELGLRRRMLRAAFGIMRSIYYVSVIAKFDIDSEFATADASPTETMEKTEGHFEDYRRQVRWLLRQAVQLEDAASNKGQPPGDYAPFYAEEIVWLYNESGVLSLVQGRIPHAIHLFDLALNAARRIEPNTAGFLHSRILLNRAIAQIERGRGADVREDLEHISRHHEDEHPLPPLIAKGYLGLVCHLTGQVTQAHEHYDMAIKGLLAHNRARAASIFKRHKADLYRAQADPLEMGQALALVEEAIRLALESGHEDIRHMALLSRVRIGIVMREPSHEKLHVELNAVERYARLIGMPRLAAEAAELRAVLHRKGGDMNTAGTVAAKGLEIATRNGLRLRKINLLLLLADINAKRGQLESARPLLELATGMARNVGSYYALAEAQNLRNRIMPPSAIVA